MQIERISSGVLASNTYVLTIDDECLIIDAGVAVDELKQIIGNKKVVGVLLTHGHYDHSFYIEDYIKTFGAKVYVSKYGKETLEDPKCNYSENFKIENFENFVFIDEGKLKIGKFKIECINTPGHTKCSCSFLIDSNLFTGDTLFYSGIGRDDLIGGSREDLLASLKKIQKIKFEHIYPGHGRESNRVEQERNINAYIKFMERKK